MVAAGTGGSSLLQTFPETRMLCKNPGIDRDFLLPENGKRPPFQNRDTCNSLPIPGQSSARISHGVTEGHGAGGLRLPQALVGVYPRAPAVPGVSMGSFAILEDSGHENCACNIEKHRVRLRPAGTD
jgi:hypothetical protein